MFKQIANLIINRKQEQQFITATVATVNPLTVKITPTDSAIAVISTTSLLGIQQGSRVVLTRFGNKFIATSVLGDSQFRFVSQGTVANLTNTTFVNTAINFSFKANSTYFVNLIASAGGNNSNGIKTMWEVTGSTVITNQVRWMIGQAFGQSNRNDSTMVTRQAFLTTSVAFGCDTNAIIEYFILNTASAGTLTLQAAKQANVVTGTNSTISGFTTCKIQKIGEIT